MLQAQLIKILYLCNLVLGAWCFSRLYGIRECEECSVEYYLSERRDMFFRQACAVQYSSSRRYYGPCKCFYVFVPISVPRFFVQTIQKGQILVCIMQYHSYLIAYKLPSPRVIQFNPQNSKKKKSAERTSSIDSRLTVLKFPVYTQTKIK